MNYFGYDTNAMAVGETNQGIVVRRATLFFCALAHRPIIMHAHVAPQPPSHPPPLLTTPRRSLLRSRRRAR